MSGPTAPEPSNSPGIHHKAIIAPVELDLHLPALPSSPTVPLRRQALTSLLVHEALSSEGAIDRQVQRKGNALPTA